jgi:hypothetical protein
MPMFFVGVGLNGSRHADIVPLALLAPGRN